MENNKALIDKLEYLKSKFVNKEMQLISMDISYSFLRATLNEAIAIIKTKN